MWWWRNGTRNASKGNGLAGDGGEAAAGEGENEGQRKRARWKKRRHRKEQPNGTRCGETTTELLKVNWC